MKPLKALSNQVINLLEPRKSKILLEKTIGDLKEKNLELERFAYIAVHNLKSPLNTINSASEILSEAYEFYF